MSDRTVVVKLKADATGYTSAVDKASKSTKELGDHATGVGTAWKSVGMAFAGTAVLGFLHSAIDAASDLNETVAKTETVFKDSAGDIKGWAKTAADSMGMSEQAAMEAAATFGNLFTALKIGVGPAAEMSKGVVQLAADLASFNNVNPEEALLALRAGLVGEAEPLRRFGVNLNQATIEAKALTLGLWDGQGAITASAKAQAAYAVIMEQTKTAQGDFARTSEGLANQQRIMAAHFQEAKAALGEALLPAMNAAVGVASQLFQGFAALPDPIRNTILALTAIGIAVKYLGPAIEETTRALKEHIAAHLGSRGAIAATAASLGKEGLVGAYLALGAVMIKGAADHKALMEELASTPKDGETVTAMYKRMQAAVDDYDKHVKETYYDTTPIRGWIGAMQDLGAAIADGTVNVVEWKKANDIEVGKMDDLLMRRRIAVQTLSKEYGYQEDSLYSLIDTMDLEGKGYLQIEKELLKAAKAKETATVSTDTLEESTATLADTLGEAKDKAKAFTDAIWAMNGGVLNVNQATAAFEAALDAATDQTKDSAGAVKGLTAETDLSTEAGRKNLAILDELASSAIDHASAVYEQTGSIDEANAVLDAHKEAMYKAGAQVGLTREQIDALTGAIKLVPKTASTTVTANTSQAVGAINGIPKTGYYTVYGYADMGRAYWETAAFLNWARSQTVRIAGVTGYGGITRAEGGLLRGPGSKTSDSIPLWGSTGEYVISAAAVDKYGVDTFDRLNAMKYASGGLVGRQSVVVAPATQPKPASLGTITLVVRDDSGMERLRKQIRVGYGGDVVAALGS